MLKTKKRLTRSIVVIAVIALILGGIGSPVFAYDDFTYITLEDSADFTIVEQGLVAYEEVTVVGLDYSLQDPKVAFDQDELQYLSWATSDSSVALFLDLNNYTLGATASNTDSVYIVILSEGAATVTVTYDTPTADPVTVTSYVVMEGTTTVNSVSGIDFSYDDDNGTDYTMTDITVPLFDAGTAMNLSETDSADILDQSPSALHALLYTLEIQNSTETLSTPIANFDWNWVRANVTLQSQGSYVYGIDGVDEYYDYDTWDFYGWQYTVNDVDPGHAGSVTPLVNNDEVDWFYDVFVW